MDDFFPAFIGGGHMFVLFMVGFLALSPGELVMKNGKLLAYKGEYKVEGPWVKFTSSDGDALCLPLKMVDLEKSIERDKKLASEIPPKEIESRVRISDPVKKGSFAELAKISSARSAELGGSKIPTFTGLKKTEAKPGPKSVAPAKVDPSTFYADDMDAKVFSLIQGPLTDWAMASHEVRANAVLEMTLNLARARSRNYGGLRGGLFFVIDAADLLHCIDTASEMRSQLEMSVAEAAAACVILMD